MAGKVDRRKKRGGDSTSKKPARTADGILSAGTEAALEMPADVAEAPPAHDVVAADVAEAPPVDDVVAADVAEAPPAHDVVAAEPLSVVPDAPLVPEDAPTSEGLSSCGVGEDDSATLAAESDDAQLALELELGRGPAAESQPPPTLAAGDVGRAHLKGLLEALIFVSDKPLSINDLARAAGRADRKLVRALIDELRGEYSRRGIHLDEVASGVVFRTSAAYGPFLRDAAVRKPVRMTRAQLETLAIVAYRQPLTRPEIDEVRGVDSGPVLKMLLERDLVRIMGKKDEPGRPLLYGTTPVFLEFFGLKSLKDLPSLREFTELSDDSRRVYEREMDEPFSGGGQVASDGAPAADEATARAETVADEATAPAETIADEATAPVDPFDRPTEPSLGLREDTLPDVVSDGASLADNLGRPTDPDIASFPDEMLERPTDRQPGPGVDPTASRGEEALVDEVIIVPDDPVFVEEGDVFSDDSADEGLLDDGLFESDPAPATDDEDVVGEEEVDGGDDPSEPNE